MPTENRNPAARSSVVADHLPPPPVPADADLRRFEFLPLSVAWLRDSSFAIEVTGDEFRAGMLLWCASWHQVPAGSLPIDDRQLAALAGYGVAVRAWLKVRGGALHGWRKFSDGRLYHDEIAKKVLTALGEQIRFTWRRECDRIRKANARGGTAIPLPTFEDFTGRSGHLAVSPSAAEPGDHGAPDPEMSAGQAEHVRRTSSRNPSESALKGKEMERRRKDKTTPSESLAQPADRGSRLPKDWQPGPEDRAFAASLGVDPDATAARFRDYWTAAAGPNARKLDWSATWRNWCRQDVKRQPSATSRSPHGRVDERAAEARRNADRIRELEAQLSGAPPEPVDDLFAGPTIEGTAS